MAFREVAVSEVREVLRLTAMGRGLREVARLCGLDRKTVRRYLAAARAAGFDPAAGEAALDDALIGAVCEAVRPARPGGHGHAWAALAGRREQLQTWLDADLRLTKIQTLVARGGLVVPGRDEVEVEPRMALEPTAGVLWAPRMSRMTWSSTSGEARSTRRRKARKSLPV